MRRELLKKKLELIGTPAAMTGKFQKLNSPGAAIHKLMEKISYDYITCV